MQSQSKGADWAMTYVILLTVAIAILALLPPEIMRPLMFAPNETFHALGFAVLVLVPVALRPKNGLWLVPAALLFGTGIELVQPYFGRGNQWSDIAANTGGCLVGGLLGWGAYYQFSSGPKANQEHSTSTER